MNTSELDIFTNKPFLFWVKDGAGKYVWGNEAINRLAGEEVAGKTDRELSWAADADRLQANDKEVLASGEPHYMQELVNKTSQGKAMLNACKWREALNGTDCCFGISFVIE